MNNRLLSTKLSEAPLAVFDFETTGINPYYGHRIVEVGILTSIGDEVQENYETFVNPRRMIPEDTSEIHGIYDEDVEDSPFLSELLPRISSLFKDRVLVAHNAPFDLSFLHVEYHLAREKFSQGPVCDTVKLARARYDFPDNRLGTICGEFGIENQKAHRALEDVKATFEVFKRFARDLEDDGKTTVADWLKAQGGDVELPEANHHDLPGTHPIAAALEGGLSLKIEYCDKHGSGTERVIEPLMCHGSLLVAYCHLRDEQRTFRLDRIETIERIG